MLLQKMTSNMQKHYKWKSRRKQMDLRLHDIQVVQLITVSDIQTLLSRKSDHCTAGLLRRWSELVRYRALPLNNRGERKYHTDQQNRIAISNLMSVKINVQQGS